MNTSDLMAIDKLNNLVVITLGAQNSGKSYTWKLMFGKQDIRTSKKLRRLKLGSESINLFLVNGSAEERQKKIDTIIDVFLVNGSAEERGLNINNIVTVEEPRIVLCSIQDIPEAKNTFAYFVNRGYFMLIYWLNPGYHQPKKADNIVRDLLNKIPENTFIFKEKDGNYPEDRVAEIKDFIYSWAKRKRLLKQIEKV